MAREQISKFGGVILGYVETLPNGNKKVTNFTGKLISTYEKSSNLTRDALGRIIANGDVASGMLLPKELLQ